MNKAKRILALLLVFCLSVSTLVSGVSAEESSKNATREYIISEFVQSVGRSNLEKSDAVLEMFSDFEKISDVYKDDISRAVVGGILKGYNDRTIRPGTPVKRVEAMVMLARSLPNLEATGDPINFTDVPQWAKKEIDYLSAAGLVKGYGDGRMGADDYITIEHVGLLTDRSDEALRTVDVGESYYGYINEKLFRNVLTESTTEIDALHGAVITKNNAWSHMGNADALITAHELGILAKLMSGELKYEKGTPEQRIHDMLECLISDEAVTEEDAKNIRAMRQAILDTKSLDELLAVATDIYKLSGINVFFDIQIAKDKETGVPYPLVSLAPTGSGGVLAFRTKTDTHAYKNLYADLIADYMKAIGAEFNRSDIQSAIELQIASSSATDFSTAIDSFLAISVANGKITAEEAEKEHWDMVKRNPHFFDESGKTLGSEVVFDTREREAADAEYSGFDLCKELERYGFTNLEKLIIPRSEIVARQRDVISEKNFTALKINAILRLEELLNIALDTEETVAHERLAFLPMTLCLTDDVNEARESLLTITGETNLTSLSGSKEKDPLNMFNLNSVAELLPNDIGLIYTNHFYDDATSLVIAKMVQDIGAAYKKRFEKNAWMDKETKENAIKKIENMLAVIGYPDNYTFPEITPLSEGGSLFSNKLSIKRHEVSQLIRANAEKEFIRTQMIMPPDMVNAGYIWGFNTMNIPAGILNPPMYDPNASYETNLGSIGMVIAHEIGHAFDSFGSQYDENGCLKNWWTEDDAKDFAEIQKKFVEYYSHFEVVDGVVQNSEITIGENMADFAAMTIVMDIIGDDKEKQKECLEAYANMWAGIGSVSYITRAAAMTDVHSRGVVRVNAIVASLDAFYEVYDIDENDPMYVAPENRLKLW